MDVSSVKNLVKMIAPIEDNIVRSNNVTIMLPISIDEIKRVPSTYNVKQFYIFVCVCVCVC